MREIDFLRLVPALTDLPDQLLEQVASEVREVSLEAGQWLFREGDEATSLYVVRSGRVEVVAEGDPEILIRVVGRGHVLGELALLSESKRSASVRARRDCTLVELSREQFETLIAKAPSFAIGLTRSIAAQLAASQAPAFVATPPRTLAVVGLNDGAEVDAVAEELAAELRARGTLALLRHGDVGEDMEVTLDRAEAEEDRVLLVGAARRPGDGWTDFCIREADLVLAICAGPPAAEWLVEPEDLFDSEFLITEGGLDALISALRPSEVQVVAGEADMSLRIERTARRLTGTSIGLVLSGGGARALAHLGVLDELEAAGVVVDRIGAVSMGAIVGASYASGMDPEEISTAFRKSFVESNPTSDYAPPVFSMVRGKRTRQRLRTYFADLDIEALPLGFFCVSCDLVAREPVYHRTGSLYEAVRASLCIPGVFPPIATPEGRLLVDGGVLNNLPVEEMARTGEGPIIAVDVSAQMGRFTKPTRPGVARVARPMRRALTGSEAEIPSVGETIVRTLTVGSVDTIAAAKEHAAIVIQPRLEGIGLLDWRRLPDARKAGQEAARAALEGAAPDALLG